VALGRLASRIVATDDARWVDFVNGHPDALPYHHPAWTRTICETYGFQAFALVLEAERDGMVAGVPIVALGGRVRGRRWVALPFTDSLPPLSTAALGTDQLARLFTSAAQEANVRTMEIRAPLSPPGGHERVRGVEHVLELSDADTLHAGFESQVRRNIRKAERAGLTVRVAQDAEELTAAYFDLHAETRRRLGVPTQPRRLFEAMWRNILEPGLGFALLAHHRGRPVAGAVFLEWNGRIVYKYGASAQRFWPLRPNNLIFWTAIRRGCEHGARRLDFGRSDLDDEGLRAFKAGWGATEQPLVYTTIGHEPERGGERASRVLRPVLRRAPIWMSRGVGAVFYRFGA
jgi:CelD/BcsL family acetyltransferase involved in cellulose biosynthesis